MPAPLALSYTRAALTALCLGICLAALLPRLPGLAPLSGALAVAVCWLRNPTPGRVALCCLLLGLAWATLHGKQHLASQLPGDCVRVPLVLSGEVASLPRQTALGEGRQRQRFELAVTAITPRHCAGPRRVLLSYYGDGLVQAGDTWSFNARLRRPWGLENPGSFNIQAWFAESGIDAIGSSSAGARQHARDAAWGLGHQRLRQALAARIAMAGLSERGSAVIRAITVADKSGIDRDLWEHLQLWGLNHLMVISGLHVGMLAGTVLLLARLLGRLPGLVFLRGAVGAGIALAAAAAYAALAGYSVATSRALVMLACVLVGVALGRRSRVGNALLPALAVIVLLNPLAVVGSGLWLSFAAVAALAWLTRWSGPVAGPGLALRAHLFLAVVMLPLGGLFFGGASLVSAPANAVAVPVFALWVVPLALAGAALALLDSGFAAPCWQLAVVPVETWMTLSSGLNVHYLPVAARLVPLVLAAAGVAALPLPLGGWWRLPALALLLPLVLPARVGPEAATLTVLDVGQGTAVLFQHGERVLLYDTGGGDPAGSNIARTVIIPYLRARGVKRLVDLVISHGDRDHAAGLDSILAALPVERLWRGGLVTTRARERRCQAGQSWYWPEGPRFRFLSPGPVTGRSSNDDACVLLIDTGHGRVLLAGDIAREQELQLVAYWRQTLAADILLVGHHGSASSTGQAWLNYVQPSLAIHSAGYGNRFGHPDAAVVARLAAQGVDQALTWRTGAVILRFEEGAAPVYRAWRDGAKSWWK